MGYLRLFRRFKIAPGLSLNLSKSGLSTSIGPRGAKFTVGPRGTRTTVGLPGTGLYYTSAHGHTANRSEARTHRAPARQVASSPAAQAAMVGQAAALASTVSLPSGPGKSTRWGVAAIVAGVVLYAVPPISVGLVILGVVLIVRGWRKRQEPKWQAIAAVRNSRRRSDSAAAEQDLQSALGLDPACAPAIFDLAQDRFDQGRYAEAAPMYLQYLGIHPSHVFARQRLAQSYMASGQVDEGIKVLLSLREVSFLSDESRASITAALAGAFSSKGDYWQAIELATAEIGQKRNLDAGQQQCLHVRGMAYYLKGQRAKGIHDLDRLFNVDANFPGVQAERSAMAGGTFGADRAVKRTTPVAASVDAECVSCGAPRGADSGPKCRYCGKAYSDAPIAIRTGAVHA